MLNILKGRKLILGSKSPRRSELLTHASIPYELRIKEVEEIYPDDLDSKKVPEFLASLKADALVASLRKDEILLTADSIVLWNNLVLGKPKSKDEARKTIRNIAGDSHEVITGVCIQSIDKKVSFSSSSYVDMSPMSDEEINYYVDHFNPMDKAGSYGIQEWIGYCKIKSIRGTYANIMGLPIDRVYEELRTF